MQSPKVTMPYGECSVPPHTITGLILHSPLGQVWSESEQADPWVYELRPQVEDGLGARR